MSFPRKKLKYVATLNDQTLPDDMPDGFEITYAEISDVSLGSPICWQEGVKFSEAPSRARRSVRDGDILMSTVRTYLKAIARVETAPKNAVVSTGFAVLRPRSLSSHFLGYVVQSQEFIDEVVSRSVGVSYPAITPGALMDVLVPTPSISEQQRIADYLDRETAEIDAFIADQKRFKRLLLEHREATRSSVIRKSVERQEAPHVRLKFLADVTVGIVVNPSSWYVEEGGVPALRGLNVKPEEISMSEIIQISHEGHIAHCKSRLEVGDVVVVRTGQAGAAAVIPNHLHDCNAIDLLIVKPGAQLSGDFLAMYINSDVARGVVAAQSVGAIQAHFNVEALRNLPIPFLDLPQQLRLVAAWQEESTAVDLALRDVKTSIQLAKERREALISAAVTGQIDVTDPQKSAVEQLRNELEVNA